MRRILYVDRDSYGGDSPPEEICEVDAGEFEDLKHHAVVDFFKDFLAKERT